MTQTKNIEKLLQYYPAYNLTALQRAAENGTLQYWNQDRCLLHYHQFDYEQTKYYSTISDLACEAEREYYHLRPKPKWYKLWFPSNSDSGRQKQMLPLIDAERKRRIKSVHVPVTLNIPETEEVLI